MEFRGVCCASLNKSSNKPNDIDNLCLIQVSGGIAVPQQ